jgi:lipopolysaccharide/colanic/teichoic acid biosynthesis glycosyltransferase
MYRNNDDSKYKAFLQSYVLENASSPLDENGQDIYELFRDPRVTRFGSLLRKTNIDELPQLINVLKGDMALIGPRPDIPFMVEMYKEYHLNRLRVKPGITGLWQVSGRGYLSFDDMVHLDLEYINRQSLLLDAKIVLLTIRQALMCNGGRWH